MYSNYTTIEYLPVRWNHLCTSLAALWFCWHDLEYYTSDIALLLKNRSFNYSRYAPWVYFTEQWLENGNICSITVLRNYICHRRYKLYPTGVMCLAVSLGLGPDWPFHAIFAVWHTVLFVQDSCEGIGHALMQIHHNSVVSFLWPSASEYIWCT